MEINETRRKLIDIIAEHQALQPSLKLGIGELSVRAGISRQAFNRYYSDLKDYASGKKPVGDLISDTSSTRTKELINQHQTTLRELQVKMQQLDVQHDKETKKTVDSYITSLMMNDVTMHGANDLRVTLEKQAIHNLELKKQLSHMEIELARAKELGSGSGTRPESAGVGAGSGEKIKLEVDLDKAFEIYASTRSEDDFEDKKDLAIATLLKSINKLAIAHKCSIVLFAERYSARFSIFFDNYECKDSSTHLIVRLPIFDRTELKNFLDGLPPTHFLSIHIPFSKSRSEVSAQRGFYFRNIPKLELDAADGADTVAMTLGFDEIVHYKMKQGE
ncbi:hypothetical protein [Pseudomonas viridiflava]|jgi:hypothetical protein|uniref:hypothetical protein n=1 Tax=Pseudomonas viridiflava TaxID=33069 RepID=UPI000F03E584|nr:hypothetical protein [Pseudomonas viridiflava]